MKVILNIRVLLLQLLISFATSQLFELKKTVIEVQKLGDVAGGGGANIRLTGDGVVVPSWKYACAYGSTVGV